MSILDGMISSEDEMKTALTIAATTMDMVLSQVEMSPNARKVLDLMGEGLSLADIFDITREQREALMALGAQLLKTGDTEKARIVLSRLHLLEPMDARPIFLLAVASQMDGAYADAGKLYVQFLARRATHVDGYLRLGECFLGNGELAEGLNCFRTARNLCQAGHGSPRELADAERLIQHAEARLA